MPTPAKKKPTAAASAPKSITTAALAAFIPAEVRERVAARVKDEPKVLDEVSPLGLILRQNGWAGPDNPEPQEFVDHAERSGLVAFSERDREEKKDAQLLKAATAFHAACEDGDVTAKNLAAQLGV